MFIELFYPSVCINKRCCCCCAFMCNNVMMVMRMIMAVSLFARGYIIIVILKVQLPMATSNY